MRWNERRHVPDGPPAEAHAVLAALLKAVDAPDDRVAEAISTQRVALGGARNTVGALIDLNQLDRAETLLASAGPLLEEIGGAVDKLKLRWVEAKIARAAGRHHHQAERTFREIRRAFTDERMPYYVALVNLELCAIWLHSRQTDELRTAVSEALSTFLALGIEREALASVILLDQAAQQDRATLDLLTRALREAEGLEGRRAGGTGVTRSSPAYY